ncbi:hypothetical protein T439DRAFT_325158, partial [Meredithblackwellia eburnea MCA 4105]
MLSRRSSRTSRHQIPTSNSDSDDAVSRRSNPKSQLNARETCLPHGFSAAPRPTHAPKSSSSSFSIPASPSKSDRSIPHSNFSSNSNDSVAALMDLGPPEEDEEDDTFQPSKDQWETLRQRAIGLQDRVKQLETALRIAKSGRKRESAELSTKEKKRESIGSLLELLDIDIDVTTPIFLSPALTSLKTCPHCLRSLPRRNRSKKPATHLDVWRTEHWNCLPHITDVTAWAMD